MTVAKLKLEAPRSLAPQMANLITVARIVLLFVTVLFAFIGDFYLRTSAVLLAIAVLMMDWLDGYVARKYKCETAIGSVLDIAGDRIVENVWWIAFAGLGIVPIWVPIVVISRGFFTDSVRSYALSRGKTAFGQKTMMKSKLGLWLTASRQSRGLYCFAKILAFSSLFALHALQSAPAGCSFEPVLSALHDIVSGLVIFVVAFCLIRGIPVLLEARKLFEEESR